MSPGTREHHLIAAILFTDIVGSTGLAAELGDETWERLLHRHHEIVGDLVKRHEGRVVDTAGDGVFAIFHRPASAIACAFDAIDALRGIGLDIRAGIHFGETDSTDGKVSGIVVHTASRVMALAGPGEIMITGTVKDLVAGKRITVEDRGTHDLKGIPASWNVFAVEEVEGRRIPPSIDPGDADALRWRAVQQERATRTRRIVAAAVAFLGLIIAAIVLSALDGGEREAVSVAEASLVRIDLDTDERTELSVGRTITGVALGEGSVWLASFGDSSVYRIDPETMTVRRRIRLSEPPQELAVGAGSVWATTSSDVLRIDPASGSVEQEFRIGPCAEVAEECSTDVIASDEAVWASQENTARLIEIDPQRNSVERVRLPSYPNALTTGHGALWVLLDQPPTVQRSDMETGEVEHETLPSGAHELVCYGYRGYNAAYAGQLCPTIGVTQQAVWVATPGDLSTTQLWQLDPATAEVIDGPIELRCCAMAIAPGVGLVSKFWVGLSDGGLFAVSEVSRRVEEWGTVGEMVTDLATDDDELWVTVDPEGLTDTD